MDNKKVLLFGYEAADLYGLKTLYHYLDKSQLDLYFAGHILCGTRKKIVHIYPKTENFK